MLAALVAVGVAGCNPAKKEESASKDQKVKVVLDWFQIRIILACM